MKLAFLASVLGWAQASVHVPDVASPAWACPVAPEAAKLAPPHAITALHATDAVAVEAVNANTLKEKIDARLSAHLVVFFAPWCPHCRNYVMQGPQGNAENAPLELLSTRLISQNGPKVVKFDVTASFPPAAFKVDYVPKLYMVSNTGTINLYKGNPLDQDAVANFSMTHMTTPVVSGAGAFVGQPVEPTATTSRFDLPEGACPVPLLSGGGHWSFSLYNKDSNRTMHTVTVFGAQKVKAVDSAFLASALQTKDKDVLVTFYAPWCPHCQTFVMADETGNATNAPLERLRNRLVLTQGPEVVKYDITKAGRPPVAFDFKYIPATYLVTRAGQITKFTGNADDLDEVAAFATGTPSVAGHALAAQPAALAADVKEHRNLRKHA